MSKIKLSILIPVYNTEKYVIRCLKSVLCNSSDQIEVIIINDGTKDRAIDIIRQNFDDSRLRIIDKNNEGLAAARNTGVKEAVGEYIQHLDSDDYLNTSCIDKVLEVLSDSLPPDVIIFDTLLVNEYGKKIRYWSDGRFDADTVLTNNDYLSQYFSSYCIPSICNKVFKKDLYYKNGIYHPENISFGEDGSTTPRLIAKANKIFKLNIPLHNYVQHSSSMMNSLNTRKMIIDYSIAFDLVDKFMVSEYEEFYLNYRIRFKIWYLYSRLNCLTRSKVVKSETLGKIYNEQYDFIANDSFNLYELKNINKTKNKCIFCILLISKYNIFLGEAIKSLYVKLLKIKKHFNN